MLHELWNWWQFHFWLGLACLAVGISVTSPFLLSKRFRKWFSRNNVDLEAIGLVVLVLAIIIIGLLNNFGASSGA